MLSKHETRALRPLRPRGLRTGGYVPTDFSGLADLFAAFFGDDLLGRAGGAGAAAAAPTSSPRSRSSWRTLRAVSRTIPSPSRSRAPRARAGAEPDPTETCPRCEGAGRLQSISSSAFGQFIRTAMPRVRQRRRVIAKHCGLRRAGRVQRGRGLDVEIPPGIHDGQRIRLSGEGHAGMLGGRAGDVYVSGSLPTSGSSGMGTTSSTVDLTISQAALGTTLAFPTLGGEVEVGFDPGAPAGEIRTLRGKECPCSRASAGDHRILVNVLVPRHLSDEQRRLLEELSASTTGTTAATRGSSTRSGPRSADRRQRPSPRLGPDRRRSDRGGASHHARALPGGVRGGGRRRRLELAAYTGPGGEERVWQVFGPGRVDDVDPDWGERWRVPSTGAGRPALDQAALGGARRRRLGGRRRPRTRLQDGSASVDEALRRAPARSSRAACSTSAAARACCRSRRRGSATRP